MGGYKINNFYQGGYSSLDPNKGEGFTGYHGKAGDLSTTTDPRTANLVKEVSGKLASGIKNIELTLVNTQLFDSIPKQHLKEVQRVGKLTGTEFSVHGPVMDSAGFTQQGWNEVNRQSSERTMVDFVKRAQEINPQGNGTIVFHSAEGIGSSEWEPAPDGRKYRRIVAVDRERGQMTALESDTKFYPGHGKKDHTPEKNLEAQNNTLWSNALRDIEFSRENSERIMNSLHPHLVEKFMLAQSGQIKEEDLLPEERKEMNKIYSAMEYIQDAQLKLNGAFSKAAEFAEADGDEKRIRELNDMSKKYGELIGIGENGEIKDSQKYAQFKLNPMSHSQAILSMEQNLKKTFENDAPRQFVPIEEFAVKQSSKTFGNTAFEAYKKFGDKAPIIAIENPPAGSGLSTAKELRELVQESRNQFADELVKKEGMSKKKAEKIAEKHIGATWDVGHINMIRKQGFSEKDVVKETEKIAPYVKHVHLSDNFGFEHTELPMGMGNVPFKEMMEKLPEKDTKKVIEAAQWWQHFQTNPFKESLTGVGSPVYSSGEGPFWNQYQGFQQSYSSGYGQILPNQHFQTYGSGFSSATLPMELGGNMPGGGGSRMSGTPME